MADAGARQRSMAAARVANLILILVGSYLAMRLGASPGAPTGA